MNRPKLGILGGANSLREAKEAGADFLDLHFRQEEELLSALEEAKKLGLKLVANIEGQPLDWLPSPGLRKALEDSEAFLGFMLDECDHMQLNAHWPVVEYYGYGGRHYFAETEGLSLDEAQEAVEKAIAARTEALRIGNRDVAGEYLYPGMMHTAARAGLSASPKVLKETAGPVMLAAALGASLQYGGTFGVDCDAWWHPETVGHTDVRFASALRLAYWAGADRIYIEGGFGGCGHPSEETQPRLFSEFARNYVPEHPRFFDWRNYRPEVAIIRQDDTCFDIRQRYPEEYPGPLYGHIPAQAENTEWLNILSLLSHGYVRNDSATRNWEARSVQARTLFAPFYKLAIFDETVTGEVLDTVKLFFLTGPKISGATFDQVAKRVRGGAVCVIPPRFVPENPRGQDHQKGPVRVEPDGEGKWIIVEDFYFLHYETWTCGPCDKRLRQELLPLIGDGETLVYDFGEYTVRASLRKEPMKNGKTYHCGEIPRAVREKEDELVFLVEKKS